MKIEEVVSFFGGKRKLADALDISPAAVTRWQGDIPKGRQYQIQILTKGRLKACDETTGKQK